MKDTYYYIDDPETIAAILRDGFTNDSIINGRRGVYVADAPGEPDPDYPDDQLFEITLPLELNTAQWQLDPPTPCRWGEWLIPARILNEHGKLRPLTKAEWLATWGQWEQAWSTEDKKRITDAREELVRLGFLEQAKDAQGQLVYRNGQPVWKATEKSRQLKTKEQFQAAFAQAEKAERKTKYEGKMPDPEIIRANAAAFEQLALNWRNSITGQTAYPKRADLATAVLFMILDYFDCANSANLYFGDLRKAIDEKLRLDQIKHCGLKGLPRQTGRN